MPINQYHAMFYLNDWFDADKPFHNGLKADTNEKRRIAFVDICKYYRITRNFKILPTEERLQSALDLLEKVPKPGPSDFIESTMKLASAYKDRYEKYALSAASKTLWVKHLNHIIIYDNLVGDYLISLGYRNAKHGYSEYCAAWTSEFSKRHNCIEKHCSSLISGKHFSLAHSENDTDLQLLCSNQWFQYRVFDKFAWIEGSRLNA